MKFKILNIMFLVSLVTAHTCFAGTEDSKVNRALRALRIPKTTVASIVAFFRENPETLDADGKRSVSFVCLDITGGLVILKINGGGCIDFKGKTYIIGGNGVGPTLELMGGVIYGRYHGSYTEGIRGDYDHLTNHKVNSLQGAYGYGAEFAAAENKQGDSIWILGPQIGWGGAISSLDLEIY